MARFPGKHPSQLAREINSLLDRFNRVVVSREVLYETFRQPERATPLGDAIATFCGLPNEEQNLQTWLCANRFKMEIDIPSGDFQFIRGETTPK